MDHRRKSYTLSGLAEYTHSQLVGDPKHLIEGVADLETATSSDASFLAIPKFTKANPKYFKDLISSKAGVICIDPSFERPDDKNYLLTSVPSQVFQQILELFHPPHRYPSSFTGIHPTSTIHPSAYIAKDVVIGPHVVIDAEVVVGEATFIGAGTYIGARVSIGRDCILHPRVTIREECKVGNRVIIQPGAVIGSCGFGYFTDEKGTHTKLNQVGNVIIEDDVEIGANAAIDRARFKSTVIGRGTKIDNLVQLAHGVNIGPHNIIVAQTGIAGSTSTGSHVVIGGQVAVAGHIRLENGVMVAAKSGVSKSLPPGKYNGIPALPLEEYNRNAVYLRNIETYIKQIKNLEKRINTLENK